jgi:hypothetical protein
VDRAGSNRQRRALCLDRRKQPSSPLCLLNYGAKGKFRPMPELARIRRLNGRRTKHCRVRSRRYRTIGSTRRLRQVLARSERSLEAAATSERTQQEYRRSPERCDRPLVSRQGKPPREVLQILFRRNHRMAGTVSVEQNEATLASAYAVAAMGCTPGSLPKQR